MRAVYFRGEGVVDLVDVPTPIPSEGELLVQVAANAVCGSDRKILRGGFGRIPGHEMAGTVVQAGPGCQTQVGARVAAFIPMFCGKCALCQRGQQNICLNRTGLLGWSTDGGYAEYTVIPDRNALALSDRISFHEGVLLLDTIGTSGHALRLSRCWEAESLLVIGAGPIGIGAVALAKAWGVPNVYVSELAPYRRRKAEELGAIAIDPQAVEPKAALAERFPHGVDIVFEAVGIMSTIWQSFDLVRPGGAINFVGEYGGKIELDRFRWMISDITAIRSFYFTIPEFYENQEMVLDGTVAAAALATHTFPLTQVREAYALFATGESLKIMVEP